MVRRILAVSAVMALLAIPISIVAGMIPSPVPPRPPPKETTYVFGPEELAYGATMPAGWFKKFQIQHEWHYAYFMSCHAVSKHFVDLYKDGQFVSINDALDKYNTMDIFSASSHHDWRLIALSGYEGSSYCSVTVVEKF